MWMAATQLRFPGIIITKQYHHHHSSASFRIHCSDSKGSTPRGFIPVDDKNVKKRTTSKEQKGTLKQEGKSRSGQPTSTSGQAPGVGSRTDNKYTLTSSEFEFEQKLQAVKRSALEKKKVEEKRENVAIDYDAPIEPKQSTVGLGTKIGVGVAVVVFGLVFALGDFLPNASIPSSNNDGAASNKMSKEETAALQSRLQQYETTLSTSPKDPVALEGAAVILAELGEYTRAATLLEDLVKEKPSDPDVFRLLGEVKYELKDYGESASAYKSSAKVSKTVDFDVLRGLTNALLAANKPDEAVQVLLESRESLNKGMESQGVDPIQVDMLLGKAYSDWGHVSDAVSVYDQLISSHPNDFRGYLAKGILLKQNGNIGNAERMFIQARFFAPDKAKTLVDRYARS